ncbi:MULTISPECIES: TadE/TadG family type IV pilus assembly protein [Sphingomonas]|uniref:TadE/TadG family type IV pilus assembly protein n=1 Tax=Sphingomonas TaxID=13687 RepID=UPI000DEFF6BB|nr:MULTISPECIES: TadE family protein [Sphingomonas]
MRALRALLGDRSGAAAAEFVLCLPIFTALIFGAAELGNYFYNEHILVKAVRDGARFAARQDINSFTKCASTTSTDLGSIYTNTRTIVRQGVLSGGSDRLNRWSDSGFSMSVACSTTAGTTNLGGFYANVKNAAGTVIGAPVVTVTAQVPYQSVLGTLGLTNSSYNLNATQQAAVIGW